MRIAIASGKGGTGKTTIATNLAVTLAASGRAVAYLDCDVEEPNGHVFLNPDITATEPFSVLIPKVDLERCTFCGQCADVCHYNAIAVVGEKVLIFPELCHSCGGCFHICPEKAIAEVPRRTGVINSGISGKVDFVEGRLNIGEAQAPPLSHAVKEKPSDAEVIIIDAPPGTSCPVVEVVRDCDYVTLVTEPTPFGLNDLKLAVDMVKALAVPFGVIINRVGMGDDRVEKYLADEGIDLLMSVPHERQIAESYSRGGMALYDRPAIREQLVKLYDNIKRKVPHDRDRHPER